MNAGLLMLAGHAIYQDGEWHGGHPGEGAMYAAHVRDAFRIFRQEGYHALALSGCRSRPHLPLANSEAGGMYEYACHAGLVHPQDRILLEHYGRDSFENLFFSILAFHRRFGEWPARVAAVSWKFKALRFYLIARGLHLPGDCFRFYGSGDPAGFEAFAVSSVQYDSMIVRNGEIVDPLHRDPRGFASKRMGRTPKEFPSNAAYLERVAAEYGCAGLIDQVEAIEPGPAWRAIAFPWSAGNPD